MKFQVGMLFTPPRSFMSLPCELIGRRGCWVIIEEKVTIHGEGDGAECEAKCTLLNALRNFENGSLSFFHYCIV